MKKINLFVYGFFLLLTLTCYVAKGDTPKNVTEPTLSVIGTMSVSNTCTITSIPENSVQSDLLKTRDIPDGVDDEIETVLLPSIFNLLGKFGVNITPFAGLITFLIMWLIRRFERKKHRKVTASAIRSAVGKGISENNLPESHVDELLSIADKLEGIKRI